MTRCWEGPLGGGQAVAGAVLVEGAGADDGEDVMAVAAGVGEPLDEDHAHALGPAGAVRALREGLAAAVGRESALAAEVDEGVGSGHDGHAARERHVALAALQGLDGHVQGDQRGRAGRVDGDGGAFEAQDVGDAAGRHAAGGAGAQEPFDAVGQFGVAGAVAVVVVDQAGEDTGRAAAQRVRVEARTLEGLPGRLQQQPLLRVHGQGLAGG
ncbi:hypothetical protein GCM10020000_52840 [Streptomyces olivoverticillatus]